MEKQEKVDPANLPNSTPSRRAATIDSLYRHRWMASSLASACFFATTTLLVSPLEVDTLVVGFWRAFFSCALALVIAFYNGTKLSISTITEFKLHVVNGIFTLAAVYLQFYAYQHMAAADASAIIYAYIALSGFFGRIILKEAFGVFEIALVTLAFAGIVLIARPPFLFKFVDSELPVVEESTGIFPPLVAFCGTISAALHTITMRAMGKRNIEVMKLLFYSMLISAIVLAVLVCISRQSFVPACTFIRLRLFLAGVTVFLGVAFLSYALSLENVVYVALVCINEVFIVFAVSVVFLGFQPKWTSLAGMFLITGSSIVILVRKILINRKKERTDQHNVNSISMEPSQSTEPISDQLEGHHATVLA